MEPTIVPLVSRTTTSKALWDTLASTFASSSRRHVKQLKAKFKSLTKGPQSIIEFMHAIKMCTDQFALLDDPVKPEDITDKVLESLDSSYSRFVDAINARDGPISFAELHEKLLDLCEFCHQVPTHYRVTPSLLLYLLELP
ncbi:retrovirus-related pol polyprotein from transposon RE1 [Tanacetum coccineum]